MVVAAEERNGGLKMTTCRRVAGRRRRTGAAWLEVLLVLAFLALLFQVFPGLWELLWHALDVRRWSSATWMALNVIVLVALFGVRFGPDVIAHVRERRKRLASSRKERSAETGPSAVDEDLEARRRRDADWVKRAKKRLPWQ